MALHGQPGRVDQGRYVPEIAELVWANETPADSIFLLGITIKELFGAHCSGTSFQHDILLESFRETHCASQEQADTQTTASSIEVPVRERNGAEDEDQLRAAMGPSPHSTPRGPRSPPQVDGASSASQSQDDEDTPPGSRKRDYTEYQRLVGLERDESQASDVSEGALEVRMAAFQAMLGNVKFGKWQRIGLLSTDDKIGRAHV